MSTSGTTTWQMNRDAVITAALRKLAVISGNATPEAYQITNAAEALNAMIKGFYADGMPVWAIKSYTFTPVVGQALYQIGPSKEFAVPMPLKVLQAWRNTSSSVSNIPMNIYTNYNYDLLPLSNAQGTPINLYYQPLSTYGEINLWPKPQDTSVTITIRYQRPFEDMNASTDDFDFPSYWSEAIIYGLASRLAPEYGIPLQDRQVLKAEAKEFHETALLFGTEEGSFYFQPDWAGKF